MSNELKLGLRDNAYSFLKESMEAVVRAKEDSHQWNFAVINAAQAIELLLKERLRREHSLLVYTNIDKPGLHTVSLDAALNRLASCGVELDAEDLSRLRRAKDIRNSIVHFELNVTAGQLEAAYIDLFEFAHIFHQKELDEELHDHIPRNLWAVEAELMERFRREFITYQGGEIIRWFASEIVDAQAFTYFRKDGRRYYRIPYGKDWTPSFDGSPRHKNCHDCMALVGQFHARGCDSEQCPRCRKQLFGCSCNWRYPIAWWGDEDFDDDVSVEE